MIRRVAPGARPDYFEDVPCPLCGQRRERQLYCRPYESAGDGGMFTATTDEFRRYGRIVLCRECGLVYTNPRPKPQVLAQGYGSNEDHDYLHESSSRSINAHLSLSTIKSFVLSGRLLEIGSSVGYFLNAARVDFDVVGLEPAQWACKIARERFRLECRAEGFEEATDIEPAGMDVIAMIDVLEHLTDPKAALRACARWLRPQGLLYIVTPDIGSLSAQLLGGYWWGLRPAHVVYFDLGTLERMLREAGFELLLSRSFGRIFSYGYWASRLRHYPRPIYRAVSGTIRTLQIEDKFLYINTRDSLELCARRIL